MRGARLLPLALAGAALALTACQPTSVGVSYGYNDPFYWNHYYYGRDIDIEVTPPDRPDRPDRPPTTRPPVAKPLPARPPTHRPSRPAGGGGRLR